MKIPSLVVHRDLQPGRDAWLDNDDIRPLPASKRTWTFWTWNFFWLSAVTTAATFYLASAFVVAGLTPWEGIGCYIIGNSMIAVLMCFTGRPGAVYGFPYPVQCRVSFGVWGAIGPAVVRAVLSCVWQGVSTISAAKSIYIMLHAIFPSIAHIHDTMGPKSALTSAQKICLVIFLVCIGALLCLDVHKWKRLIYAKAGIFAASTIILLAFTITKAGGVGATVSKGSSLPVGEKVWLCLEFIAVAAATSAFFATNASDWQRNSVSANAPIMGQLIGFPLAYFVVPLIGMLTASSSQLVYNEVIWDPFTYVDLLLSDNYTPGNRAAVFFIGAGLAFSGMVSTIMENCITAANDLSSVFPKFITIKRGCFLAVAISLVIQPWYLMGSAAIFLDVINGFNIFLLSNCGVLVVDYLFVAKGQIAVGRLYDRDPDGPYFYWRGVNLRAYIAYLVGLGINFPGYLQSIGAINYGTGLARSYYFAPYTSTLVAGGLYWLLSTYPRSPAYTYGKFEEPKAYRGFEPGNLPRTSAPAEMSDIENKGPVADVHVVEL